MPVDTDSNRQSKTPEPKQFGSSLIFLFWLLILLNLFLFREPQYRQVPYSQFIEQVEAGKVVRAVVGSDRIQYELKSESTERPLATQPKTQPDEKVFVTTPVAGDVELTKILRQHKVEFSAPPPNNWGCLLGRSQIGGASALTLGRSKARIYSEGSTGVTFDDVAGVDEAKVELQEIVEFLKYADKYIRLGAKIPKGVLLVGPPGTGKTLLAKAIAGEAGVPFFSISGSEFIELFVGLGAARVRDLFEQAKRQAPCIVFIDELDALGKSRVGTGSISGGNDEREQTLNQLLSELDGFEPNTGVILLAATNRPEVLDPALLRPGRFDRQIVVDRPDKIGREAILRVHAKQVQLSEDVDLGKLAARTPGFAGADLANLVNEAALLAARNSRNAVTMDDFNEAIERVLTGLEKKSRVLNQWFGQNYAVIMP